MGDRYELHLHCKYCGEGNEVYYAPTCGFYTFKCSNCSKINGISSHNSVKAEDVTGEMLYESFLSETNVNWTEEELKEKNKECFEIASSIRNSNKVK